MERLRALFAFAARRAEEVRLAQVAASLTFSSVMALVPLLAVVLAVLTAFPVFGQFRESLEKGLPGGLLPDPYAQVILRYLSEFASKATSVGAIGLVLLVASALSVILTVDRILNDIWRVHRRRPWFQRVLVYWAVLTIGPLLLGASLSLTSFLVGTEAGRLAVWGGGLHRLLPLASPLLAAIAYSVVYMLVPNRPVHWTHAVGGGIVTAAVGEVLSRGFAVYVAGGSLLTVYGAFAAIPIFLLWIYVSWLVFLFGAALAATIPQLRGTRIFDVHRAGERFVCAVAMLRILLRRRNDAGAIGTVRTVELAQLVRVDHEEANAILSQLEKLGYVRRLAAPAHAGDWVLSCDPHTKGLAAAFHAFAIDPDNSLLGGEDGPARWLAPGLHGRWLHVGIGELEATPRARP